MKKNKLASLFGGSGMPATNTNNASHNNTQTPGSRQVSPPAKLDTLDLLQVSVDLAATNGLKARNNTANDFDIEPAVVLQNILRHSPFKYDINPAIITIDSNGDITFLANLYQSINYDVAAITPNLIGVVVVAIANDMLIGTRDVRIRKTLAGTDLQYSIQGEAGAVFVWNHVKNQKNAITNNRALAGAVLVDTAASLQTNVDDFLYYDPTNIDPYTLSGVNVQLEVYPVVGRIEVYNALIDALFTGNLATFAQNQADTQLVSKK